MTTLLFLHVAGAVLLVGNIITAAFWHERARRTGNAAVVHSAAKTVMLADGVFTLPGIMLLVVSGAIMAERSGYGWGFHWLTLSLLLFGLSGAIWLAALLPLQRRMIRLSRQGLESGVVPQDYLRVSAGWNAFGTIAALLPVIVLYLMIAKPW